MSKRMTIMIIILVIVFGGLVGFNLLKQYMMSRYFAQFEPPAVTISSVKAIERDWNPHIEAVGNFVAINGVNVNSQASGNVVYIYFTSGAYVAKNSPLIQIDDSVEQSTLKYNQAALTLRDINYKRQQDLFKRGATPSSSVDEAKASLQQAQADVEKIQAQITQKHIIAPFAGQLGIRLVNLGQYITPGDTAIVTLQSLDPLFLEFYLPEQLFKQLYVGQKIQFRVEAYPGQLFSGNINAINSKVDPSTHNIMVQAMVANCPRPPDDDPAHSNLVKVSQQSHSDKILVSCNTDTNTAHNESRFDFLPGMFADISIELPTEKNVVVVPSTAISFSLYGNSVFLIEKDPSGKKDEHGKALLQVKRVFVTTGAQQGNYTVIQEGLKAGQEIVSSGEVKLQNGTRVIINNSVRLDKDVDPSTLGE